MTHDELVKEIEQRIGDTCGLWISDEAAAAVLRVCVEELLGDMRTASDEWALIAVWVPERSIYMSSWADVNLLLKNRRARYSPPKPKTLEEMIETAVDELFRNGAGQEAERLVLTTREGRDLGGWCKSVIRDKITGLIAELKQKEQSKC